MNADKIKEYCDLRAEIKDLETRIFRAENEINKLATVKPASYRLQKLQKWNGYRLLLINHRDKLTGEVEAIQAYINGIDDTRIKKIMHYKYIKGLPWVAVAFRMGGTHTAEGCRKAAERFFASCQTPP